MKTIICPVDFSPNANNAALYATQVGNEFNSRILLVHVYESPILLTEASVEISWDLGIAIKENAEKRMEALRNNLLSKNKGVFIDTKIIEGFPAPEICSLAIAENADTIIMGATGKGKAQRMIIGSTASKVMSDARCPVLLIPRLTKYKGIKKIVIATDLNKDNLALAKQIVPFARHFNAEIAFVFVDDKHLIHSEEYIAKMSGKIRSHVHYQKLSGYVSENKSVSDGINYFVKKHSADLLVMFKHKKLFPGSFLNPSITKKMSFITKIPLLSIPVETSILAEA